MVVEAVLASSCGPSQPPAGRLETSVRSDQLVWSQQRTNCKDYLSLCGASSKLILNRELKMAKLQNLAPPTLVMDN